MPSFGGHPDFNQVRSLVAAGIFGYLDKFWNNRETLDGIAEMILNSRYRIPNMDYDTAYYVANQYEQFRTAGQAIMRRRSDTTADSDNLPIVMGCEGKFEYDTVTTFQEGGKGGRKKTFPYKVVSDVPLGKLSIQADAMEKMTERLSRGNPWSDPALESGQWQIVGTPRIMSGARCV